MADILIVDDRALNRQYLRTLLTYQQHSIREAADGGEALALVRERMPDLVITDIAMPGLDGVEFVKRLQNNTRTALVPVIFYSATYRVADARQLARGCNATAFLPKPSDPEVIIAAVRDALGELPAGAPTPAQEPQAAHWNPVLAGLMDFQFELADTHDARAVLERVLTRGIHPGVTFSAGARVPAEFRERLELDYLRRAWNLSGDPRALGLPPGHCAVTGMLIAPLAGSGGDIGWLYLVNRTDGQPFSDRDEEMVNLLARQAASAYENRRLARLAARDGLTGLGNRREFEAALARELERALRQMMPLALIMADVDHFKRCNDRFGHPAGDALLRAIGAHLDGSVRGYDRVFRYGGEEFAVLLPGATAEDAMLRADQIRAGINALELRHEGQLITPVTVSLGVAAFPEHGKAADALLCAADRALYESKGSGRDRACIASASGITAAVSPPLVQPSL